MTFQSLLSLFSLRQLVKVDLTGAHLPERTQLGQSLVSKQFESEIINVPGSVLEARTVPKGCICYTHSHSTVVLTQLTRPSTMR